MAKKFTIMISRTCYESFDVEADTEKEAIEKAHEQAYNTDWASSEADYNTEDVSVDEQVVICVDTTLSQIQQCISIEQTNIM